MQRSCSEEERFVKGLELMGLSVGLFQPVVQSPSIEEAKQRLKAVQKTVKEAYRRAAVKHHPDKGGDSEIGHYDGDNTPQPTDNSYDERVAQAWEANMLWQGYHGSDYEVFLTTAEPTTLGLVMLSGLVMLRRKQVG